MWLLILKNDDSVSTRRNLLARKANEWLPAQAASWQHATRVTTATLNVRLRSFIFAWPSCGLVTWLVYAVAIGHSVVLVQQLVAMWGDGLSICVTGYDPAFKAKIKRRVERVGARCVCLVAEGQQLLNQSRARAHTSLAAV